VQSFITDSLAVGGRKLLEVTKPLPEKGWYVNPVLLGGLDHSARACQEEIFGPIAVLVPFKDSEDAIRLANDTKYGLAANVWCNDPIEARRVAERVRAGTVWINGGGGMRPDAPFGGFGRSGIGRELGEWGIREYLEVKHVQWRL
jgi:aldehyde dehydrogenase (NAD+)/betaine-aldehyde dehydrogenase